MQDTCRNFPGLAYNLYPKAENNIFIMQYSLTKVYPFRLGNKELPSTCGYWRPIRNTSIPRICPAVPSAIYFLYHSVVRVLRLVVQLPSSGRKHSSYQGFVRATQITELKASSISCTTLWLPLRVWLIRDYKTWFETTIN